MNAYFFSLFFGTFVLEDVSLAAAIALLAKGKISLYAAFAACFLGIVTGDIALYFLGRAFGHMPFVMRRLKRFDQSLSPRSIGTMLVVCRFVPGTRVATYLGSGFLKFPFVYFLGINASTVAFWVALALLGGDAIRVYASQHIFLSICVLLTVLLVLRNVVPRLLNRWDRKTLIHGWRKWTHFEFWPAWFFYLPMIPHYIYHSLRGRSFLLPFYANPGVLNGGIIGESKWDFLKHLDPEQPSTLKSVLIPSIVSPAEVRRRLNDVGMAFPFILKPDVGQRGYGVRIVRGEADLEKYLLNSSGGPLIAQELSELPMEAGIFYYRRPSESSGTVFSITDKKFPVLKGDGSHRLGDLILRDSRARIIAPVYFERLRPQLDRVPGIGETVVLAECGNHCQGAIFKNGQAMITPELTRRIDQLARTVPDFYFGRFDVRYKNPDRLKLGEDFEIVEVNGAGSEATHIWDADTRVMEAYRVLRHQWGLVFSIGQEVKMQKRPEPKVSLWLFLKDFFHMTRRQDGLSVSS